MKNIQTSTGIFLLILFNIAITGCGIYSFSSSGKPAFSSVHVGQFENRTIEFELGTVLTDAVIDMFISDNSVEVLESSRSEAIMTGTVVSYAREAHEFDLEDNVAKYAVKVSIHVRVVRANSDDVIWEDDFFAEGIYEADTETEEDGQIRVVELLSSDILDKTTKSW